MKLRLVPFTIAFVATSFAVTAQWVQDASGNLSTSKQVTMSGPTYVTTSYQPFQMNTSFQSFLDINKNTSVVGYMPNLYNFVWGKFNGTIESGSNVALRVGKVVGAEWTTPGYLSTAIGENVGADGSYSFALGFGTRASSPYSLAVGNSSTAGNVGAVALGKSTARGQYSSALGFSSAAGDYAFAGGNSTANANNSAALNGGVTGAKAVYSTAINKALADGANSFAAGSSYTLGQNATALGFSQADADYAFSSGYLSGAYGTNSSAIGTFVSAVGKNSMILGLGVDNANQLTNKIDNSLIIGFNSATLPSVFVGPADASNKETRFGFVGIGTTTPKYELSVNGSIVAKNAVIVENLPGEWPDYVFRKDYSLQSLSDVEKFIASNHHLPGVPSQEEIKKEGLNLGEMEMIMMRKIEELTLYVIKIEKENEALRRQMEKLQTKD